MAEVPGLPIPYSGEGDSWMGIGISINGAVFGGIGELREPVTPEQIEQVALELAQGIGHILLQEGIIGSGKTEPEDPQRPPEYGEA